MSKFNKAEQKSMRVVLPLDMYDKLKAKCQDHGDMSRIVRHLLRVWLADPRSTIRQIYDLDDKAKDERQGVSIDIPQADLQDDNPHTLK